MAQADVLAARSAAISAYADAVAVLVDAYVELAAADRVCESELMATLPGQRRAVAGFLDRLRGDPMYRRHAEAAPAWPASADLDAAVAARVQSLIDGELAA